MRKKYYDELNQGDIINIDFSPAFGHEEKKYRPAIVVSTDGYNKRCGGMVIVCPISNAKDFPLHEDLPDETITGGKVLCEHVRALDLSERTWTYVEHVSDKFIRRIVSFLNLELEVHK